MEAGVVVVVLGALVSLELYVCFNDALRRKAGKSLPAASHLQACGEIFEILIEPDNRLPMRSDRLFYGPHPGSK